jgi:hypothetical protein
MTTSADKNLFVQNGQLYITPTLTSDEIGNDAIFDGGSYSLGVRIPVPPPTVPFGVTEPHVTSPLGLHQLNGIRVFHQFGFEPKNRHTPGTECADQYEEHLQHPLRQGRSQGKTSERVHTLFHLHGTPSLTSTSSDWLWPAVWMLPVDNVYGDWPASGEIDVSPLLPLYRPHNHHSA